MTPANKTLHLTAVPLRFIAAGELFGYFPKIVIREPDWLKEAPVVEEICSVSNCISKAPPDWIDRWKHNKMWMYDSPELAWSVVPEQDRGRYTLFAYRILPHLFNESGETELVLPDLSVVPIPDEFSRIGYDAVSRSCGTNFECSPLSCNHMAPEYPVNKHCLVDNLDTAVTMARTFARGNCEPGPYCVIEVWKACG